MPRDIDLAGPYAVAGFARLWVEGAPGTYEEILHFLLPKRYLLLLPGA